MVDLYSGYWTCDGEVRHVESFDDGSAPEGWEPLTHCGYCGERMSDNTREIHEYCASVAQAHARQIREAREYAESQEGREDRRLARGRW